jgi:hypothetical protein
MIDRLIGRFNKGFERDSLDTFMNKIYRSSYK